MGVEDVGRKSVRKKKDSLIQLLMEQFVSGYVQLRRRKRLEVYT